MAEPGMPATLPTDIKPATIAEIPPPPVTAETVTQTAVPEAPPETPTIVTTANVDQILAKTANGEMPQIEVQHSPTGTAASPTEATPTTPIETPALADKPPAATQTETPASQPEQAKPPKKEIKDNLDEANQLLKQSGSLLFESYRDPRFLVTMMGNQALNTPLGLEIRRQALEMVAGLKPEELKPIAKAPPANPQEAQPDPAAELKGIQEKIKQLNLERKADAPNEMVNFIEDYNLHHQDGTALPPDLVAAVKSNAVPDYKVLQSLVATFPPFRDALWREIKGGALDLKNPQAVMEATGIKPEAQNLKDLTTMISELKVAKNQPSFMSLVSSGVMMAMMLSTVFNGLANEGQGAAAGH